MDAGAFSDNAVIDAAKDLVLILVDCSSANPANEELKSRYSVSPLPTVVLADSQAREVGKLVGMRDSATMVQAFSSHAKQHTLSAKWEKSVDAALAVAKKESKPVLLFVADPKNPNSSFVQSFFINEASKKSIAEFVIVRVEFDKKNPMLKKLGIRKGAKLVVIDPMAEAPLDRPFQKIGKVKTPKKFNNALGKAVKKWTRAQAKKAAEAGE